MSRFIVISGCSGGGKSTLLAELGRRGFATIEEPGRRIVTAETAAGGTALPWIAPAAFARRAVALALSDLEQAAALPGPVFFDRGLVDAAAALEHCGNTGAIDRLSGRMPYQRLVFLAPPWPEIYVQDDERRHGFKEAAAEHDRLKHVYSELGYTTVPLPKNTVAQRADFVIATLVADGQMPDWPSEPI
jgi:predicted ATPase